MENNEDKAKAQHSTGKHPEPSDNVQSDIETVTPDTENEGLEDVNKHESQNNEEQGSEKDEKSSGDSENADEKDSGHQVSEEKDDKQQGNESDNQSDTEQPAEGDERSGVETVSP